MAAVPIYVWNGTAWQETGPTIPANPIKYQTTAPSSPSTGDIWVDSDGDVTTGSQQFQRFRFVASGGETTISGADANGAVLAYTAGLEQVVLNGAVLVRGHDYTATTGTTITGLSPALVASDVLEVFSFIAFSVANTYTQSQVDGLVATAIDSAGLRLITPSSVVGGTIGATGAVTFSGASTVSLNGVFSSSYQSYKIVVEAYGTTTGLNYLAFRLRTSTDVTTNYNGALKFMAFATGTSFDTVVAPSTYAPLGILSASAGDGRLGGSFDIVNPFLADTTAISGTAPGTYSGAYQGFGIMSAVHNVQSSYTGFTIYPSISGTITGTVRVYGYKN